MIMKKQIIEILNTEVDIELNKKNLCDETGFLSNNANIMAGELSHNFPAIKPLGVNKNTPIKKTIGFVYEIDNQIKWCPIPINMYDNLLK